MSTVLEQAFLLSSYPSREHRLLLARMLCATERQVLVWFQNRRQREKRSVRFAATPTKPVRDAEPALSVRHVTKRPLMAMHGIVEQGVIPKASRTETTPQPTSPPMPLPHRAMSLDSALGSPGPGLVRAADWLSSCVSASSTRARSYSVTHDDDKTFDDLADLFEVDAEGLGELAIKTESRRPSSCSLPPIALSTADTSIDCTTDCTTLPPESPLARQVHGAEEPMPSSLPCSPAMAQTPPWRGDSSPTAPSQPLFDEQSSPKAKRTTATAASPPAVNVDPQVFLSAEAPHVILWASQSWLQLCGFERLGVVGRTLSILSGCLHAETEPLVTPLPRLLRLLLPACGCPLAHVPA